MLARFISSHEDGYIFREFRYLQSRTLLHMQDELRALELQLHRMDLHDARNRAIFLKTREMDDDRLKVRGRLMEEIAEKLKTYGMLYFLFPYFLVFQQCSSVQPDPGDGAVTQRCWEQNTSLTFRDAGELLIMSNNLANFDRPSRFDIQSLENFFRAKEPLFRHERYIGCQSDMITLKAGRDDAWLDRVIMQLLVKYNCAPLRVGSFPYYLESLSPKLTHLSVHFCQRSHQNPCRQQARSIKPLLYCPRPLPQNGHSDLPYALPVVPTLGPALFLDAGRLRPGRRRDGQRVSDWTDASQDHGLDRCVRFCIWRGVECVYEGKEARDLWELCCVSLTFLFTLLELSDAVG